jgi:alpha-beta hydrolase superfamily lysophospholipase
VAAQPYAIGNTTRDWYDEARSREVPAVLHYPAEVAGDDQPMASGMFPVLVIGHGFVMGVEAYDHVWQHFVPLGYIVVLPTTEGSIAPDHAAFGQDLAFCAQRMQLENADDVSLFFGHVEAASALLGHSMGGGAALLGAEGNAAVQAVVVMAPAETNPSAITSAAGILAPTLVFAASEDCVAPIAANQQPMYDALVPCKALVNITGGGHCYFGDPDFLCEFGEFTCGPSLTITRAQQHDVITDLATLWLDHYLRNDAMAFPAFQDSMTTTTRAITQGDCLSTGVVGPVPSSLAVRPSPTSDVLNVSGLPSGATVSMIDALGRTFPARRGSYAQGVFDVSELPNGLYRLAVITLAGTQVTPFVVVH